MRSGTLWVVATPIGCLEDITLRALRLLREAEAILAEDTRHTRVLCTHYGIETPLRSLHAHSKDEKIERIARELAEGARYALVSDAGTPLVSDPGARLVEAALAAGVNVEAIPGPSAVIAALSIAGLRAEPFRFVGFLPRSGSRRRRALETLAAETATSVLFESPRRLAGTLHDLGVLLERDRRLAVCRELTKVHQQVERGTVAELLERFAEGTRGEVTLLVEGRSENAPAADVDVEALARTLLEQGLGSSEVARRVAQQSPLSRQEAYRLVLELAERV